MGGRRDPDRAMHPFNVTFDVAKRERLREAFNQARVNRDSIPAQRDDNTFTFEDRSYVIAYAYYLLQYLDEELGDAP